MHVEFAFSQHVERDFESCCDHDGAPCKYSHDTNSSRLTMSMDCNLPEALEVLCSMPMSAFRLGATIAQLLLHIPGRVWGHLDHSIDFHNPISNKVGFPAFVGAIDQLIIRAREMHGTHNALPDWHTSDHVERRGQLHYVRGVIATIEAGYKCCALEAFEDRFLGWSEKETQWFNQGMAVVPSGTDWRILLVTNVLIRSRMSIGRNGCRSSAASS